MPFSLSFSVSSSRSTADESLPRPATTNNDLDVARWKQGIGASAAPSLIALTTGLLAVSSNQPKAMLLFIGAGSVTAVWYFVVPPNEDSEEPHSFLSAFLGKIPDVFTTVSYILALLGIGFAFPKQIAVIPLFVFIFFTSLAILFCARLDMAIRAVLYGAGLVSLLAFVILAIMA